MYLTHRNLFGEQCLKANPSSKPTKQQIQALYNVLSAKEKKVYSLFSISFTEY